MPPKIFISYSTDDRDTADEIRRILEEKGLPCWIAPRNITAGRNYHEAIIDAIEQTFATVLILSDKSNESPWVVREIERVISKGKPVFPMRIKDVEPSKGLELLISSMQWIDAWGASLEERVDQLARAVWEHMEKTSAPAPAAAPSESVEKGSRVIRLLAAWLIRKGDLTRYVLAREGIDPDELCSRVREIDAGKPLPDQEAVAALSEKEDGAVIAGWIMEKKKQSLPLLSTSLFDPDEPATESDAAPGGVTEADVLRRLVSGETWEGLTAVGAPGGEIVNRRLEALSTEGIVDENGALRMEDLTPPARRILRRAHGLAQLKGLCPITHRVLLAAFMLEKESFAAAAVRRRGQSPKAVFAAMMETLGEDSPKSFGLGFEACERILLPVLTEARKGETPINDKSLFIAFCKKADPDFKQLIRTPPISLDLDEIRRKPVISTPEDFEGAGEPSSPRTTDTEPSMFNPAVWRVIDHSARMARKDGWLEIRSPHVFAAMIECKLPPIIQMCRRNRIRTDKLKQLVLYVVAPKGEPAKPEGAPGMSENTRGIFTRAQRHAAADGRRQVNEDDLFRAFFEDGGGVVGEMLRRIGLEHVFR
jgi:hypothetical protein